MKNEEREIGRERGGGKFNHILNGLTGDDAETMTHITCVYTSTTRIPVASHSKTYEAKQCSHTKHT